MKTFRPIRDRITVSRWVSDRRDIDGAGIDPSQAEFWAQLSDTPFDRETVEKFGIEYVVTTERYRKVRRQWPVPTVVNAGYGLFSSRVVLLFIDDETGRVMAYAPPGTVIAVSLGF